MGFTPEPEPAPDTSDLTDDDQRLIAEMGLDTWGDQ